MSVPSPFARAVAYVQAAPSDTFDQPLDVQRAAVAACAAEHDQTLVALFEDNGIAATVPFSHRPGAQALIRWLDEHGPTVVIVSRMDRLGVAPSDMIAAILRVSVSASTVHFIQVGVGDSEVSRYPLDTGTPLGRRLLSAMYETVMEEWGIMVDTLAANQRRSPRR